MQTRELIDELNRNSLPTSPFYNQSTVTVAPTREASSSKHVGSYLTNIAGLKSVVLPTDGFDSGVTVAFELSQDILKLNWTFPQVACCFAGSSSHNHSHVL